MKVSMISAMAKGRVIGTGTGGIPWRLPRDSGHFRAYTQGHHMLLGRKTYEEMDGWFTTQVPIVLTRRKDYEVSVPGGAVAGDVGAAIRMAESAGDEELVVSGGASVYASALPFADELVLTFVDAEVAGGAFFPDWEEAGEWEEVRREEFAADEENEYGMAFVVLKRQGGGGLSR